MSFQGLIQLQGGIRSGCKKGAQVKKNDKSIRRRAMAIEAKYDCTAFNFTYSVLRGLTEPSESASTKRIAMFMETNVNLKSSSYSTIA